MMNTVPLGEVAYIAMGSAPPGESYNSIGQGLPMIAGAGDYGEKYPEPKKWTTSPSCVTETGDLIVCVRATIGNLNWADKKYCLGRGVAGIRPKKGKLDINFSAHYLNAKKHDLSKLGTGSTFLAIRRADLENFPIPLPPLPEQKRIAAILDKADAIRRKRQAAIKLADDFLRATFLDMFGDPVTNPKSFNFVPLSSLYSTQKPGTKCGPFGSALRKHEYRETGISVWTMDNIQGNEFIERGCLYISEEKFMELKSYTVDVNDILISRAGTVGKMCIAKPSVNKSIISTNLIRLSLNSKKIEPTYFVCLMIFFQGKVGRLKTGEDGAYSFMNTGVLNQLSIPLPPVQLQKKYTDIFCKVKQIQKNKHNSFAKIDMLFNSLTQRAFRGEL